MIIDNKINDNNSSWYELNIEPEIRDLVKNLRENGINTFCSCGHGMWIQCETYDPNRELEIIHIVMSNLNIKEYQIDFHYQMTNSYYDKFFEIMLPKNGKYYRQWTDNEEFNKQ